jgi:hypothetical protein
MASRNTQGPSIQGKIDSVMAGGKRIVFADLVRTIKPNTEDTISSICQSVLSKSLLITSVPTVDPMDCILGVALSQSVPLTPTIFLPYRTYMKRMESEWQYAE